MIRVHPLVREHLRHNAQQAYMDVFTMAFVVMLILTLVEVTVPAGHPNRFVAAIRPMLEGMAWLGIAAAVLFLAINRFSQVQERTRHFAGGAGSPRAAAPPHSRLAALVVPHKS